MKKHQTVTYDDVSVHTSRTCVKAPLVTFLAMYDLSTGSPRDKIYWKKRNPRKSARKVKNLRTGETPGFQLLPSFRTISAPSLPKASRTTKKMPRIGVNALHALKKAEGERPRRTRNLTPAKTKTSCASKQKLQRGQSGKTEAEWPADTGTGVIAGGRASKKKDMQQRNGPHSGKGELRAETAVHGRTNAGWNAPPRTCRSNLGIST
jgi:hypothetical protein